MNIFFMLITFIHAYIPFWLENAIRLCIKHTMFPHVSKHNFSAQALMCNISWEGVVIVVFDYFSKLLHDQLNM